MAIYVNGAGAAYCPQCTEFLGSCHFCYNCGWDPMELDYRNGELSVADWESRWDDYSDFDYEDVPF